MSRVAERFRDASYSDVVSNPSSFGAPTFDEFRKNREKYIGRDDEALGQVDKLGDLTRKFVQKVIYEIEGYRCSTLEEVEKIASNQGIPLRELDYRPHVIPMGSGKWDAVVKFMPKKSMERRRNARLKEVRR